MAKRKEVPLGKAIIWTDEQLDAETEPTPANIAQWVQEVINGWKKYALQDELIDADPETDGQP